MQPSGTTVQTVHDTTVSGDVISNGTCGGGGGGVIIISVGDFFYFFFLGGVSSVNVSSTGGGGQWALCRVTYLVALYNPLCQPASLQLQLWTVVLVRVTVRDSTATVMDCSLGTCYC